MDDRNKYERVTVGDVEYKFSMLPAVEASRLATKLRFTLTSILKSVGNMDMSDAKKAVKDIKSVNVSNASSYLDVIGGIIDSVEPDLWDEVCEKMIRITKINVNGEFLPASINANFSGKVMDLMIVVVFALRHNYADFLDAFLSKLPGAVRGLMNKVMSKVAK